MWVNPAHTSTTHAPAVGKIKAEDIRKITAVAEQWR